MALDLPNKTRKCHRTNFTKSCRRLVVSGACERWTQMEGTHPQTGQQMVTSCCNDDWNTTLLLDLSRRIQNGMDGNQKAIESFRNAVVVTPSLSNDVDRLSPVIEMQKLINGGSHESDD